jgi:hypothetical protein
VGVGGSWVGFSKEQPLSMDTCKLANIIVGQIDNGRYCLEMQIDTTQVHYLPKSRHLIYLFQRLLRWVLKIINIQPTLGHTLISLTSISS